jgi:cell wall-associated NlpC family hydrolase
MRVSLKTAFQPRRIAVLAALCLTLAGILPAPAGAGWLTYTAPALTVPADSEAGRVITVAMGELRDKFKMGAIGPNKFDCSGFVFYVYKQAGLLDRIGNKRKGATSYRNWFAARGWRSPGSKMLEVAQAGDILIWGNGHHAGIYLGNNWAVSALVNPWGVSIHRPLKLKMALTDVLHVQISRESGTAPTPSPSPTPSPTPTPSESPTATPEPTETPAATPTPIASASSAL